MGAGLALPAAALAESESESDKKNKNAAPTPIPGGLDVSQFIGGPPRTFHFFFPAIGQEVATIFNFQGDVVAGEIQGTGVDSNGVTLTYDADMRVMSGKYVAVDGRTREATFAFV
jgi:hypothetical protein